MLFLLLSNIPGKNKNKEVRNKKNFLLFFCLVKMTRNTFNINSFKKLSFNKFYQFNPRKRGLGCKYYGTGQNYKNTLGP